MADYTLSLVSSIFLIVASLYGITCLEFIVINNAKTTPGGIRFEKEIGLKYAKEAMETTSKFIWNMLNQNDPKDRRVMDNVTMYISEYKGAEAFTQANKINVSSVYLEGYQGNLTWEFTSLVYHEMTHVWQSFGAFEPIMLIEGIADYTILKANYYPPLYAKPGMGDKWDQGYDFTARFLEYCEGLKPGFVPTLNKMMNITYKEEYFVDLLGKPVNQLWKEYKAKFGGKPSTKNSNTIRERRYSDRYLGY
ncbi:uncharacterized protein LOC124941533 [Impatiens glandulifera]|uniref:uncharacterized protein LOC124941533 n=1 Tax=Impatiens glandulifera TaxID=253017 RepID=UPI001FB0CF99|nr:uncharacterized protein LOC124941533 [Impatiens glandulifera]